MIARLRIPELVDTGVRAYLYRCATCSEAILVYLPDGDIFKAEAEVEADRAGWRPTRKFGWRCKDCCAGTVDATAAGATP